MSHTDDAYDPVESIHDALTADDPERALTIAIEALESPEGEDPVIRYLGGKALLDLGRTADAVAWLGRAVELDPDDPEFRVELAVALYHACRFEEARLQARAALAADESFADAHEIAAVLSEREGRFEEAERGFARAAALDPERCPAPRRLSREEFESEIVAAGERLSAEFRKHLSDVVVTVEDLPSDDVLLDDDPPLDPELCGLFVGTPLGERSAFSPGGELPPRILLFQRNLERFFPDPEELREEIAVTLHHELGHYLGLDEEELEAIDLG